MNKKTLWILVGAVVVLVIAAMLKSNFSSDATIVLAEEVVTRDLTEVVSANGKVQPEVEVKISSDVSGEVISLTIKEGDSAHVGQVLAEINPDLYMAAVNRAEASLNSTLANQSNARARLEQSKAQLQLTQRVFERQQKLYDDEVISQAEYDQALSNFNVAEAEVSAAEQSVKAAEYNTRSARATLKEAKDNLKRTIIVSPIEGTVSKLSIEKGERVVGTSQMAGTEMMRIADLTSMEVDVEVNESDIVRVKLGDTADIEVDAYVDRIFKGVVTEIANSSSNDGMMSNDQLTVFNVKIRILPSSYGDLLDVDKPNLSPFRPGMSATVDVITARRENTITIPIQAVTIRTDSTEVEKKYGRVDLDEFDDNELVEVVFVLVDGIAEKRVVKTGIQDSKYVQILSGVEEGEQVITGPYSLVSSELSDGDEVEVGSADEVYGEEE